MYTQLFSHAICSSAALERRVKSFLANVFLLWRFVVSINLVLSVLRSIPFQRHQVCSWSTACWRLFSIWAFLSWISYNAVSSAYKSTELISIFKVNNKTFMKIKNSRGPRIDHWETLYLTISFSNIFPFILTCWVLLHSIWIKPWQRQFTQSVMSHLLKEK